MQYYAIASILSFISYLHVILCSCFSLIAKNIEAHSRFVQLLMRREKKQREIRQKMDKEEESSITPPTGFILYSLFFSI